jgi:hypothetical protein
VRGSAGLDGGGEAGRGGRGGRLINGKLTFAPNAHGIYEFSGRGTVRPLLAGVVRKLASPTGFEPVFWP